MLKSWVWWMPKSSGWWACWGEEPWRFLEERHHSITLPPYSSDFQAAQHYTFSTLWSKALSKKSHVISNWKRHSTTFHPAFNQCGHFPILIKSSVSTKITSDSILWPEFQGFDGKLGILDFIDPNQCWTQRKAQCPMVTQEHDYFWTQTTTHKHSCEGLIPLPGDRLFIPKSIQTSETKLRQHY